MAEGDLIVMLGGAISVLFGIVVATLRQNSETWKGLYLDEKSDHQETRKSAAAESRENAQTLKELAAFIHNLPRRAGDWTPLDEERRRSERR
jgi:hypothetical protein